jgi:hypothetical protein
MNVYGVSFGAELPIQTNITYSTQVSQHVVTTHVNSLHGSSSSLSPSFPEPLQTHAVRSSVSRLNQSLFIKRSHRPPLLAVSHRWLRPRLRRPSLPLTDVHHWVRSSFDGAWCYGLLVVLSRFVFGPASRGVRSASGRPLQRSAASSSSSTACRAWLRVRNFAPRSSAAGTSGGNEPSVCDGALRRRTSPRRNHCTGQLTRWLVDSSRFRLLLSLVALVRFPSPGFSFFANAVTRSGCGWCPPY